MARATSFRLPDDLLARLQQEGRDTNASITSLVTTLLDEGLKARQFPGIVYRDGPAGRRAALLGGPDLWEVVRDLKHTPGRGMRRIERLAEATGIAADAIALATAFYAVNPDEIDAMIEADDRAADGARQLIARREKLLSS